MKKVPPELEKIINKVLSYKPRTTMKNKNKAKKTKRE